MLTKVFVDVGNRKTLTKDIDGCAHKAFLDLHEDIEEE